MRSPITRMVALMAVGALLAGCGAADDDPPSPPPVDDPVDDGNGVDDGASTPGEDDMDTPLGARVGEALRLLADETGEETTSIEVVLAEEVTWSDGSIGCPQPGEMYTQALVDGYRIVLELDGERFTYHGADGEPPFRCDDPAEPVEGS